MTWQEPTMIAAPILISCIAFAHTIATAHVNRTPRLALRIECLHTFREAGEALPMPGIKADLDKRYLQLVITNLGNRPATMLHATSSMKVPQFVVDTGRTFGTIAMHDSLVIAPESTPTMRMVKIDHKAIIDSGGRGHWVKLRFVGLRPIRVSGQALHDCLVNGTTWNWSNTSH